MSVQCCTSLTHWPITHTYGHKPIPSAKGWLHERRVVSTPSPSFALMKKAYFFCSGGLMEAVTAGLNSLHWHWHGIHISLPCNTQISWDISDLGSSHYVIGLSAQLQKRKFLIPFPGKRRLPMILWCHIPGIPSGLFIHCVISHIHHTHLK